MRRDVFQAIADPTRREIIHLIANDKLNVKTVARHFHVSRPAISKQMKILSECGLVSITRQGREHFCEARLEQLEPVHDWVEQYRKLWAERLASLDRYLTAVQRVSRKRKENIKSRK